MPRLRGAPQLPISSSLALADVPKMRQMDISFALTVVLNALSPAGGHKHQHHPAASAVGKPPSEAQQNTAQEKASTSLRSSLYQIGFLGKSLLLPQPQSSWRRRVLVTGTNLLSAVLESGYSRSL